MGGVGRWGIPALVVVVTVLVLVPAGASRQGAAYTWEGTWDSSYGVMVLSAGGSGTYDYCHGKLSGSVSGDKLTGTPGRRTFRVPVRSR